MRGTNAQGVTITARKPVRKPDQLDEEFAGRLALAMTVRRVRPSDLAERVPVHRTTVSMWRRGTRPHPPAMARIAQLLDVPFEWLSEGVGEPPSVADKAPKTSARLAPSDRSLGARTGVEDAEGEPPEGAGWLWEDPREAEEGFRSYIRNVERSVRGMVGDPDGVKLKELRLIVIDMARSGARAAGRQVPPFVQVVENEIISGTFR